MDLFERIAAARERWNVLKHPFYTRWERGELTRPELAFYAGEYRHAVVALADAAAAAGGFDLVLCMSIHPGYSGQPFMEEAYARIEELRRLVPAEVFVQVDGGVGHDNIAELHRRGADLFVCGTAIFGREDLPRSYRRLVRALA
jgi:hypothetical protein